MRETYVFEKREATGYEKATRKVYDPAEDKFIEARYQGIEEAENRLEGITAYPCVYCTEKSYIPVRFRDTDKYIITKNNKRRIY